MIRTSEDGAVCVLTLDRPARRNALSVAGLDALRGAVGETDAPVVYVRGAGSAFCAGADLSEVEALDGDDAAAFAARGQAALDAIEATESVVVAGIDGPARGGGVELALACDIRVATPEATFAEPGVKLGIFGAWGGTRRLPDVVGLGDALDLSLSGRTVDAETSLRMGLVSRVTEEPRAVADEIAANDAGAIARVKELLRNRDEHDPHQRREAEAFAALVAAREE